MTDTGPSDAGRAAEVRRALDRLRDDLADAGIDLADPRARQLVIASIGGAGDRKLGAAAKRALALDLRAGGASYREIARQLGWASPAAAHKAVKKALDQLAETFEEPEEWRALLVDRLEAMWAGLAPKATKGDSRSIIAAVRLMGELRHLVPGLDIAVRDEDAGPGSGTVNVTFHIPDWDLDEPAIPQDRIGAEGQIIDVPAIPAAT